MAITGEELAGLLQMQGGKVSKPRRMSGKGNDVRWVYDVSANDKQTTVDVHRVYEDAEAESCFDTLALRKPTALIQGPSFDRAAFETWAADNGVTVTTGVGGTIADRPGSAEAIRLPKDDKLSMAAVDKLCGSLNLPRRPEGVIAPAAPDYPRQSFFDALRQQEQAGVAIEELPNGAGTRVSKVVMLAPTSSVIVPPGDRLNQTAIDAFCRELHVDTPANVARNEPVDRARPRTAARIGGAIRGIFAKIGGAVRPAAETIVNDNNADRGERADGERDVRGFEQMRHEIEERENPDGHGH